MTCLGVLLAAGASRRFGATDKLLAPWRGRPLLSWAADALRGAGCDGLVAVVSSPRVAQLLPDFTHLMVPTGGPMSQSFQAAIGHGRAMKASQLLLCLGDMPNVDAALLARLMRQPGSAACVTDGRRMPPALIAAADYTAALSLPQGDHGARALIAMIPPRRLIPIPAVTAHDVDRPGDLAG